MKRVKVAVTGGAGQIGYALLFRLVSGEVFGQDTIVDLNLLELPQALPSLEGVVMELVDCAFPTLGKIEMTSDMNAGMNGINWALLVGAVPRKQGMERGDLLEINGGIFTKQGKAINDNADGNVRILVVGNPCNTNSLIAMNNAPDIPRERFYAMTMLDELRARAQLAQKADVAIENISNMTIWGNHSATQYPDFYNAKINGKPAADVINNEDWLKNEFVSTVQQRGAAIIKARGASSAASAANAIMQSVRQVENDTKPGESYSLGICSNGEYGVDEGLIFSFPCRTEKGEVKIVKDVKHNPFGIERFNATLNELRQERDIVKEKGLIG